MASSAPRASSPLNPYGNRYNTSNPTTPSNPGNLLRRPVSISPTERLQRYKAADAWRRHVLMEEARAHEKAMMDAIQGRQMPDCVGSHAPDERGLSSPGYGVESACLAQRDEDESKQHFQLPDLSFLLTPRKVALAAGLMERLLPVLRLWRRCESLLPRNE